MMRNNPQSLLLIGGTGILSSAVMEEAVKQGLKVTILNRGYRLQNVSTAVEVLISDVTDEHTVREKLCGRRFDAVIDFLCYTPEQLLYSYNLFKEFATQYVFVSSFAVYNTAKKPDSLNGYNEASEKVLDIWQYSVDKNRCEELLLQLGEKDNRFITIIRPGVTYGNTRIPYGVYPSFGYHGTIIQRILRGKPIITWNGGTTRCNIMHVADFAVGVVGLLGDQRTNMQAYNICSDPDKVSSWNDVLDALGKILNRDVRKFDITSEEYAIENPQLRGEILGGRSLDWICDNSKLKSIVPEFKPKISLEEGIRMTVEYYMNNDWVKGMDYFWDGDTDRIINKYARKRKESTEIFNLGYVDYLNKGKLKDVLKYHAGRNKKEIVVKIVNKIRYIFRK